MSDPLHSHEANHAALDHHYRDDEMGHVSDQPKHGHSHAAITPLSDPALATSAGIFGRTAGNSTFAAECGHQQRECSSAG